MKTKIILEFGCNHQGQMKLAKKMIKDAVKLGVWGVKFQKRDIGSIPENIRLKQRDLKSGFGKTYGEHRRALEFDCMQIKELKEYAESRGLEFLISVFDTVSAKQMLELNIKYIKLPSQLYASNIVKQLYNAKLKQEINILLSTGMHTLEQIFENENFVYSDILFYCRSIYPCTLEEVNFKAFLDLKNMIPDNISIGYSSHDEGGEAIPFMVFLGAEYIERHYTLDKTMKGSDHRTVSSDFEDIEDITERINIIEGIKAPYDLSVGLLQKEQETREKFLEGFYMNEKWYKNIKKNKNSKAYVGPEHLYDIIGDLQTKLLLNMGLNDKHSLLDIGCGCLRAGIHLIPIAKKYVGVEPEQWLAEKGLSECIDKHGQELIDKKEPVIYGKIEDVKEKFDYIMLHSIFSHAPVNMIKDYLEKLKYLLNPKGRIIITYVPGQDNYKGAEWVYPGLVTYKKEFMFKLFKDKGYKIKQMEWPHTTQKWVVLERWVIIEKDVKECLKKGL
jgi:sialic acid synthase SpsE